MVNGVVGEYRQLGDERLREHLQYLGSVSDRAETRLTCPPTHRPS